jgi:hypothetical protein
MIEQQQIEEYNYSVFEGKEDFVGFRTLLQVGSPAPDYAATLLETGETVQLSDYWHEQDVVIEFGSHT